MANLEQHKKDCLNWLGADFEEIHKWLDEFFPIYGPEHRRIRHHREGIEQVRAKFGDRAVEAATIHILRDCRGVPREEDYATGAVDKLGLRREWPIAAYSTYTEEAFSKLVQFKLHGPMGIFLWAFIGEDPTPLLTGFTKLSPEQITESLLKWEAARHHLRSLAPLAGYEGQPRPVEGPAKSYFESMREQSGFLSSQFPGYQFAYVLTEVLVTPIAVIDYEYVEELRAELRGDDDLSAAKFAFPETINIPAKVAVDPSGRTATLVSSSKTFVVAGMQVQQVPGGAVEIRYQVANAASLLIVSRIGNRMHIRSGVHRAFLLASMGMKELPCILVTEGQVPVLAGAYPAFTPAVLTQPRPPLLMDFFDESLALTAALQRMNKVIRISAEDFLVPVD